MTVTVKQLDNEPIVIATIYDPVDMLVDPFVNRDESNHIARRFTGKVYRITDFSRFHLTFSQLVQGLAEDIRLSAPNLVHLFVGSSELVNFAGDVIKQKQYGEREARVFANVDEAVAYARAELKQQAK